MAYKQAARVGEVSVSSTLMKSVLFVAETFGRFVFVVVCVIVARWIGWLG